jgi:hypothetical protein
VRTRRAHVEPALPAIEAKRRNALREVLGWDSPNWKREIGCVGWEGVRKEGQIAKRRPITLQGFQERRSPFRRRIENPKGASRVTVAAVRVRRWPGEWIRRSSDPIKKSRRISLVHRS